MDVGPAVVFDFGGVLALCRDLWALAEDLEGYKTTRGAALDVALEDWRGPEATVMITDVRPTEDLNLKTGIDQLRAGAIGWANTWASAQQMYNNREYAIGVNQEQSTRSTGESVVDFFMGKDDSARHVPSPAASAAPQPPMFYPTTGFISYTQHAHSDWTASYRTADSPHGGGGGGGNRVM